MFNLTHSFHKSSQDYTHCSGCGLCLLVCPIWRQHRDVHFSPYGHAKALQQGACVEMLVESVSACHLCGACQPVCPEKIAIIPMLTEARHQLLKNPLYEEKAATIQARMQEISTQPREEKRATHWLFASKHLYQQPEILQQILTLLDRSVTLVTDEGEDIIQAIEMGIPVPPTRLEKFLFPLKKAKRIIISDGILYHALQQWLPKVTIRSLGEVLSSLPTVRHKLRATDLYIIECRAYHADFERLVKHYDTLRKTVSCAFNLDLQRIAIPTISDNLNDLQQAKWVLEGHQVDRIIVENIADRLVLQQVTSIPILHLAQL